MANTGFDAFDRAFGKDVQLAPEKPKALQGSEYNEPLKPMVKIGALWEENGQLKGQLQYSKSDLAHLELLDLRVTVEKNDKKHLPEDADLWMNTSEGERIGLKRMTSKVKGTPYLSGSINGRWLKIFANGFKKLPKQPDFVIYDCGAKQESKIPF